MDLGGGVAGLTVEGLVCPCNSWGGGRCPYHDPEFQPQGRSWTSTTIRLGRVDPVPTPALSDEDVDRIAKRLAKILKDGE